MEGRQGRAPPLGPISFIFMQVLGKFWPINRLAHPLWEILDLSLFDETKSICEGIFSAESNSFL